MSDVELIEVDPATLIVGANVRTDTHPDAREFAASIKARGVLEVVTAYRDDDGHLVVLRGQRRIMVATEVGTTSCTMPVRVLPHLDEADRITDQISENVHRKAMNQGVRDGLEQLALLGVSAAQIAKRTRITRPTFKTALAVAKA